MIATQLRVLGPCDDLTPVWRFRHQVYVEELRKVDAPDDSGLLADELDATAINLVATRDGEMIGACRINRVRDGGLGEYAGYHDLDALGAGDQQAACVVTRLMLGARHRGGTVFLKICFRLLTIAQEHSLRWVFIDCQPDRVGLFESLGFVEYAQPRRHTMFGMSNRLRLDLADREHLRSVNSPFLLHPVCRSGAEHGATTVHASTLMAVSA